MGQGLRSPSGLPPIDHWRLRVNNLGSPGLNQACADLISGRPIVTRDGVLEFAVGSAAERDWLTTTLREPDAPFVVDLVLAPITSIGEPDLDARSPLPAPDQWIVELGPRRRRVELFNCRIRSLLPRSNTP